MDTFLLLWFALTFAAFIAYVVYDFRVTAREDTARPGGTPAAADVSPSTAGVARREEDTAGAAQAAADSSLERIYHQINHWDWQQAVANAIASLKISMDEMIGAMGLAEPRHSFPRQMVLGRHETPPDLSADDLQRAVEEYHLRTKRPLTEVWGEVKEQFDSFLDTQDSIKSSRDIHGSSGTTIELRPDLRDKVLEVREKYPYFNGDVPLHEDELVEIFDAEGIKVHFIEGLPLLSLFVEYVDGQGKTQRAVVIRHDVHKALREFLLGHELGHWFLHFESKYAERFIGVNYYLHSGDEWKPLEHDADTFAMTALFPAPYLADLENFRGELSEEQLYEEFMAGMSPVEEGSNLKRNMLEYIRKRLERYQQFKAAILPVRIPVTSVEEDDVEALLRLSDNTEHAINWVCMNQQFVITRASRSFVSLFAIPEEEIVGKLTPLDLIVPEDREALKRRFEHRRDKRKAIFYFTRIVTKNKRVAVYSLPVLRAGEYAGSIGYLILPEQVPRGVFTYGTGNAS